MSSPNPDELKRLQAERDALKRQLNEKEVEEKLRIKNLKKEKEIQMQQRENERLKQKLEEFEKKDDDEGFFDLDFDLPFIDLPDLKIAGKLKDIAAMSGRQFKILIPLSVISLIYGVFLLFQYQQNPFDVLNVLAYPDKWYPPLFVLTFLLIITAMSLITYLQMIFNRIKVDEKDQLRKKAKLTSLNLPPGAVRFFLIAVVLNILFYYIIRHEIDASVEIPTMLMASLNIILGYFGFKSEKVLPPKLVAKAEPEDLNNETLFDSMPAVKKLIEGMEDEILQQTGKVKKFLMDASKNLRKVKNSIMKGRNRGDKDIAILENEINALKERVDAEISGTFQKVIKNLTLFKNPQTFDSGFDKANYLIITLVVAFMTIAFAPESNGQNYDVIMGSSATFLGLISGNQISKLMQTMQKDSKAGIFGDLHDIMMGQINRLQDKLEEGFDVIEDIAADGIDILDGEIDQLLTANDNIIAELDKIDTELKEVFKQFWTANFLDAVGEDVAALSTIAILCGLTLALFFGFGPMNAPTKLFTGLQWFVAYYFSTKT